MSKLLKELKQQLEEKDKALEEKEKEIKELKEELDDKNFCKEFADLYNENKILRAGLQEEQNQTAIEELEKAEKVIEKYVNNIDDMNDCLYAIDQQIKLLKGEHKCLKKLKK